MMAVPTFDKFLLPLLQLASDGEEHRIRDATNALADYFALSEQDRAEMLPSGLKFRYADRVQWASTYLRKAGLLESAGRGVVRITERGIEVLKSNPQYIDPDYLSQFPEFAKFRSGNVASTPNESGVPASQETQKTPQEILQDSYQLLKTQLAQDLLEAVLSCSPSFFEKLVLDLLLALGYGGAIEDAGQVLGRTGDNGIDGVIKEDKLGFDAIYIQAKRWDQSNTVSRPIVQAFAGSLIGQGASKGVFITTSGFTKDAVNYANKIQNPKIILIDGQQLARLMIDNNIGVTSMDTYVIKKVDSDYFQFE